MIESEYEIKIFEKQKEQEEKIRNKLIKIIDKQLPHQRYFEIIDQVKKVQGTPEMTSKRISALISEGVELEKNLVNLTEKHTQKSNKAEDQLFEINNKIGFLNNRIANLSYEMRRNNNGK